MTNASKHLQAGFQAQAPKCATMEIDKLILDLQRIESGSFIFKHMCPLCLSTLEAQMITVMGIPAAVERVFSIAGKVFKPDRCQLTDATFEKILFMLQ